MLSELVDNVNVYTKKLGVLEFLGVTEVGTVTER
jgi:hypothetical protein